MSLPSYEEALDRPDPLAFVPKYLSTSDLLSCCLVNKRFNHVFERALWENPMRIIGDGAQSRQECLEKFRLFNEVAKVARKSTIDFVSIIDCRQRWIPSIQPSPVPFRVEASLVAASNSALAKARWDEEQVMHQNLINLPTFFANAKFLFFDGVALMSPSRSSSECHPLLLSLRGCDRLLGKTILDQAESLRALIYLDLSHTRVGMSRDYCLDLSLFPSLRILKVQDAGLRDFELVQILSTCTFRLQLSSLDIRDNELTDDALADIGQYLAPCLNIAEPDENTGKASYFEDPPMYRERSRTDEELEVAPETHNASLDSPETFMKHHKNEVDLMQCTGLTALYLSGNSFTSDIFLWLFRLCNRLQIVDFDCEFRVTRYSKELSEGRTHPDMKDSAVPPAVYLLSPQNSCRLETLRIHHSLVTHTPSLQSWIKDREEAQDEAYLDRLFADASSHGYNLGAQYFLPDVNPRLHTLTLTGLPSSCDPRLLSRLTAFLRAASAQESAIERACSSVSRRRGAQVLRGLRVLRLELDERGAGPSVSGDRDADEFVAQSAGDFSFFEEEKREEDAGRRVPLKEGLRRYRMETLRNLNEVRESLGGVPEWRVRRGAPHYHWSGRLEVVSKQA